VTDVATAEEELPPVWAKFGLLKYGPEEFGRGKIAWRDGSTLLAETHGDISAVTAFFERHPYFVKAEQQEPYILTHATRVWLSHRDPPPEDAPWSHRELPPEPPLPHDFFALPHPDKIDGRAPDLDIWGYLDPGYDIFAVHPDVEALWYVWSDGDGPHPDTWGARIWLKRRA
jgi:hypothetical protein